MTALLVDSLPKDYSLSFQDKVAYYRFGLLALMGLLVVDFWIARRNKVKNDLSDRGVYYAQDLVLVALPVHVFLRCPLVCAGYKLGFLPYSEMRFEIEKWIRVGEYIVLGIINP